MAGPRARGSPCWNSPLADKDKLARAAPKAVSTNDNGTPTPTPVVSRAPTPTPVPPPALAERVAKYTDLDLQRVTKLALKSFV